MGRRDQGRSADVQEWWHAGQHQRCGCCQNAPNKAEAVKLLEYLVSDEAQKIYAEANFEYPVRQGAALNDIVASFGTLKVDNKSLTEIVSHRKQASELVDKVGFDQ